MALTRYTRVLPDYEPLYVRYTRPSLETLYIFGCIRKPYATRLVEVLHNEDAARLQNAFSDPVELYTFLWSIYKAQADLCDLVYDTPLADVIEFGNPLSRAYDLRYLIGNNYLRAERSKGHGSPYLVARKSITNLLRLIDTGPLPRLTNLE